MSAADLIAGTVMDASASLLNDTAKVVYTYAAQIPYLRMSLDELREYFQLHSIPMTEDTSAVIPIPVGVDKIVYNGVGVPTLPNDFVEPNQLWESDTNTPNDSFIPMTRRDYLPHYLEGVQTSQFIFYVWQSQEIRFLPANRINYIKIDYIRELFQFVLDENSQINVVNAKTFLAYRTAALCAEFIERNLTSANGLNAYGGLALDRATGIGVKGKQSIMTRRRAFRGAYKRGGRLG